ncbi:MAG: exodeoxyribonuclease VII large subunit [Tannerellaceae bacterium]|nr:exodeoxyribonuclease VII large subunit [Tannerellaceae bacterium]
MQNAHAHSTRTELSLRELAVLIKQSIAATFTAPVWVRGETSDLRTHSSGHCYMELVEKNEANKQIAARMRAAIWSSTFARLKPFFEHETGQPFASGIRILVRASVEYHELYGFSLNIVDVDPSYTVGDLARRRMEIIRQLQAEGILTMNKELRLPTLPSRIAVITSASAAGYGDFIRQLEDNPARFAFHCKLFAAVMQGDKSEDSIIAALEKVFRHAHSFDLVVIIRGGGAASELSCFDSYRLAANCAQFPLPIVTGIGHERDETVLDLVAHTRMKTPTAVAEFLISRMSNAAQSLAELERQLGTIAVNCLNNEDRLLQSLATRLPLAVLRKMEQQRVFLRNTTAQLPVGAINAVNRNATGITRLQNSMIQAMQQKHAAGIHFVEITEQFLRMASPDYTLRRGYSITMKNGAIVKNAAALAPDDQIVTRFADGEVRSKVI